MQTDSILPKDHWPAATQLALKTDASAEWDFSVAINHAFHQMFLVCMSETLSFQTKLSPVSRKKEILSGLGFVCSSLDEDSIQILFERRTDLLKKFNSLACVSELAQLYFGFCSVRRGYPYEKNRWSQIGASTSIRCSSSGDREELLFVRLTSKCNHQRIEEFILTVKQMMIRPMSIVVAEPRSFVRIERHPSRFKIENSVDQRRL